MSFQDEHNEFRTAYLKHRVSLGATQQEAFDSFRKVTYAFLQDHGWRTDGSPVHPHRLAEVHQRGERSEVE